MENKCFEDIGAIPQAAIDGLAEISRITGTDMEYLLDEIRYIATELDITVMKSSATIEETYMCAYFSMRDKYLRVK